MVEKRGTGKREQDEADWWAITRWVQEKQRTHGLEVMPDKVAAERIKKMMDKRYNTRADG